MTGPASLSGRAGAWVRRWAAEPLVHFLIAGAILAGAATAYRHAVSPQRIVVTQARADAIVQEYERDFGRPPTRAETEQLIDRYVRQEVLYRKGMAMGLANDDEIVRRRVIQKAEFVIEDQGVPAEPSPGQLQAWYQAHQADYRKPARASFTHIYFSPDRDGDAGAHRRADQARARLRDDEETAPPGTGDPFPDAAAYEQLAPGQVERLFGQSPFTAAVFSTPVGHWSQPVRSGYGWHLIRIQWREQDRTPALSEVQPAVVADYLRQERERLNEAALDRVAKGFAIERSYRVGGS